MASLYRIPLTELHGIGETRKKLFEKLNIRSVGDLIRYYPRDYEDWSKITDICDLQDEEKVVIKAYISSPVTVNLLYGSRLIAKTTATDFTGTVELVFFNNKYIDYLIKENCEYYFTGKVTKKYNTFQMISPQFFREMAYDNISPVYRLTAKLTNRVVINAVREALSMLPDNMKDPLPDYILRKYDLCSLDFALHNIHFPKTYDDLEKARKRLVFEELLTLNLGMRFLKLRNREKTSVKISHDYTGEFIDSLPYRLTNAQMRAVGDTVNDMKNCDFPMHRLIQGDVGCGKTAVAACVCYNVVKNGYQVAFMAPTEILSEQHFETFKSFFEGTGIKTELLTGSMSVKNKKEIRERLESGDIDILIGTHALITDSTVFKNLGCAITDEQHRFGVTQRAKLSAKGESPHVLVLSATPIPRTLGLIIYGDLEISIIDELPPGRKGCSTYLIGPEKRTDALRFIKKHIDSGKQAYIVCPLIDYGEMDAHDVNTYAAELMRTIFSDDPVGILHGKMKAKEKESVMRSFASNEISLLVSTTVIEVGVDVKNACIMMIENAEHFGLSQLHQLRGRVGRGDDKAYCILLAEHMNQITRDRLSVMVKTSDGFKIADEDLKQRGPGDLFGNKQHGLPDLNIADFSDMESLEMSREAANIVIERSPDLSDPSLSGIKAMIRLLYRNVSDDILN